jgi:cytochrome c oxidase cbb3-type subunit 3
MFVKPRLRSILVAALVSAAATLAAQGTPPQTAAQPPAAQPPALPGPGGGRGQGVFPAQQRPLGDPAVIERGKSIYSVTCSACHGVDARGGQLGGPNLLRSQLVLSDQEGELIVPVIQTGRPDKGMPPMPVNAEDAKAVATFLHSLLAAAGRQGSPPPGEIPPLNVLVGDSTAGQAFFAAKCTTCHSATGDLQGIASRIPDAKALQNAFVSGGMANRGGRGGRGGGSGASSIAATVTLPSGERVEGQLIRIDDFIVTVLDADGMTRSVRREDDDRPKVEIRDPLKGHKDLLGVYKDKDMHDVTAYLMTLK